MGLTEDKVDTQGPCQVGGCCGKCRRYNSFGPHTVEGGRVVAIACTKHGNGTEVKQTCAYHQKVD